MDTCRQWIMPAASAAVGGKFLGLQSRWAIVLAILIPLVVEGLAVLVGWWEHRSGATETEYRLARDTDPYKLESLALLREIRDRLAQGGER